MNFILLLANVAHKRIAIFATERREKLSWLTVMFIRDTTTARAVLVVSRIEIPISRLKKKNMNSYNSIPVLGRTAIFGDVARERRKKTFVPDSMHMMFFFPSLVKASTT